MSTFYEAFENAKSSDIEHFGKRGMKWGVINEEKRSPRVQTSQNNYYSGNNAMGNYSNRDVQKSVDRIKSSSNEKTSQTAVIMGDIVGWIVGSVALALTYVIAYNLGYW